MEGIKNNKNALSLLVASIILGVIAVIDIIATFAQIDLMLATMKEALAGQGYDPEQLDMLLEIYRNGFTIGVVLTAVLFLFVVLCGLKCSLQGKWRTGAIVLGVIIIIIALVSVAFAGGSFVSVIEAGASVWYLVSALLYKPEKPAPQKTIEVVEEERNENW